MNGIPLIGGLQLINYITDFILCYFYTEFIIGQHGRNSEKTD